MTTAAEILAAIREAYPKNAVVREVSIVDPVEEAIRARRMVERHPQMRSHYEERGPIADEVPEGWTLRGSIPVRRIDALMRDSTGYTAIEIKVTRGDFKRDTEEKRRAWRAHTRRFVYATPTGLVNPGEVPDGCGLWELDGRRLTVAKKATINKEPLTLPRSVLDTMLYRVSNYERAA